MFETWEGFMAAALRFGEGVLAGTGAVLLPPVLANMSQGRETVFPPAPYFLLALGVGLFIGTVVVAITNRRPWSRPESRRL